MAWFRWLVAPKAKQHRTAIDTWILRFLQAMAKMWTHVGGLRFSENLKQWAFLDLAQISYAVYRTEALRMNKLVETTLANQKPERDRKRDREKNRKSKGERSVRERERE